MTIVEALNRTVELVLASQTSAWAGEEVEQLARQLRDAIAAIESGSSVDRSHLGMLFGPTGPIQETSIDNRWGDEFLSLSQVVDRFLAE